ncbi:hypothetical protein [Hydrogenophaga sp.]|uniref:hypothetical protein n=1 Tax=Hydrogenophaga sp. TaxID=1904254 RepID=UPI0027286874|nr:hypothetical protein [Hydrogenophaga sp.]MDO9134144.1 hypothetical protein [Hydrogenophaga sp.]
MAKLVTIQLLVSENDESDIIDGLNDALRTITHPMGSGSAEGSFILDYTVPSRARDVPAAIEDSITAGSYTEGSAFAGGEQHYLLVVQQDVNALRVGPFSNSDDRDAAARAHRKEFGEDDGLYWMQVSAEGVVEVGDFGGDELEEPSLAREVVSRFHAGERVISRPVSASCFMLDMGDGEQPVSMDLIADIEGISFESLVIVQDGNTEFVLPASKARDFYKEADWLNAALNKETRMGFFDWVSVKVNELPKARPT